MTIQEVLDLYSPLEDHEKVVFLAILSHALTISMRGLYDKAEDPKLLIEQLKGANEIQHQLSSQLRHHHLKDPKLFPDDIFMKTLVEKSTHYRINGELGWAFKFAITNYR